MVDKEDEDHEDDEDYDCDDDEDVHRLSIDDSSVGRSTHACVVKLAWVFCCCYHLMIIMNIINMMNIINFIKHNDHADDGMMMMAVMAICWPLPSYLEFHTCFF